jgi:hypothetical protein
MSDYLKGKDIKVQGDCLVHCFIKKIEVIGGNIDLLAVIDKDDFVREFEKW